MSAATSAQTMCPEIDCNNVTARSSRGFPMYCGECCYRNRTPATGYSTPEQSPETTPRAVRRARETLFSRAEQDEYPEYYNVKKASRSSSSFRMSGCRAEPIDLSTEVAEGFASCPCGQDCTLFHSCSRCDNFECDMIVMHTDKCSFCRLER